MEQTKPSAENRIGIIGGGPAGLFLFKRLLECGRMDWNVTIFEKQAQLGAGMPYSSEGAGLEHITNVSGNEIPQLAASLEEWIQTAPEETTAAFHTDARQFNEYKPVPRLLLGHYLSAQFHQLLEKAKKAGLHTRIFLNTAVTDVEDEPAAKTIKVTTADGCHFRFDAIAICTGHHWPKKEEGKTKNWFDSPYPPAKLAVKVNFPVALKGSSLTAIDAVRTLARHNGTFEERPGGKLAYLRNEDSLSFRLVLHSIGGLLPAIRFHLDDPKFSHHTLLAEREVYQCMAKNEGFLPLDFLFEHHFKKPLKKKQPAFYESIRHLSPEDFVAQMMKFRENTDAFTLLKMEYGEAEHSIRRRESVHWKETLALLSYAMNYPAKHLSAEDMLRLKNLLMPLISIVIAFLPQSSCRELIALHDAGVLSLVSVDENSRAEPAAEGCVYVYTDEEGNEQRTPYRMFIDAIGQPHLPFEEFPFESLRRSGTVSPAFLRFRSAAAGAREAAKGNSSVTKDSTGHYYLQVPGISINDQFQVLDPYGVPNNRIYIMAVPCISGLNPDYSGLDFCETASTLILEGLLPALTAKNNSKA